MDIVQKVAEVNQLFDELAVEVDQIREKSGIQCIRGCVKCCTTKRMMATALEFYPLALTLYRSGQAEAFLDKMATIDNPTICPALNTISIDGLPPGCGMYETRGLICRVFGFNHLTDKYGERRISACKPMKVYQTEAVSLANTLLLQEPIGPKASNYYSRLQSIDFEAGQRLYPIGEAVRIAVETVLTHYYYLDLQQE